MSSDCSLKGQIALVTGSSRGLGKAIAETLYLHGASVVINYNRSDKMAQEVANSVNGIAIKADVTSSEEIKALFKKTHEHYGQPITIIVNNALDYRFDSQNRRKLVDMTWDDFDAQLQTTLRGALNTTQAGLADVKSIVNIGSNLFQNPVVPYQDYTAAKGSLLAFTRTTARELGPKTRCNMVTAGLLRTTDASSATTEDVFEQIKAITPLQRVTVPEDVAKAVVFFASGLSSGVTGQQLVVDGGLCMQ